MLQIGKISFRPVRTRLAPLVTLALVAALLLWGALTVGLASAQEEATICGAVSAYTPATAEAEGAITIGGQPFVIAPGVALDGDELIEDGAALCLDATLDAEGRIVSGTLTLADAPDEPDDTTTFRECGVLAAFEGATDTAAGRVTVGGSSYRIAAGVYIDYQPLVEPGDWLCLDATLQGDEIVEGFFVIEEPSEEPQPEPEPEPTDEPTDEPVDGGTTSDEGAEADDSGMEAAPVDQAFELTIYGNAPEGVAFTVEVENETQGTAESIALCGGSGGSACEGGGASYRGVGSYPSGATLSLTWVRWTPGDPEGDPFYSYTVTVTPGYTWTSWFRYSGGEGTDGETPDPDPAPAPVEEEPQVPDQLPDTGAGGTAVGWLSAGLLAIASALFLARRAVGRR